MSELLFQRERGGTGRHGERNQLKLQNEKQKNKHMEAKALQTI